MTNPLAVLLLATTLAWSAAPLRAATRTWDGSANGNWSVGANWSGGVAPAGGDDLVFPAAASARRSTTNNFILGSAVFRSIRFVGHDYRIHGALIALTQGIRFDGADGGGGFNASGTNTINAPLELRSPQTFEVLANAPALLDINGSLALGPHTLTIMNGGLAATVHLSGVISGSGGITKFAGGTLRLDGIAPNTYTGPTHVVVGRLELEKGLLGGVTAIARTLIVGDETGLGVSSVQLLRDNQLADQSEVTVNDSGTLDLNGSDDTIAALTLNGGAVDTGAGHLTLDGPVVATSTPNRVATIDGHLLLGQTSRRGFSVADGPFSPDLRIGAVISGFSGLEKTGAGELNLNGANTFTGLTVIREGLVTVTDDDALGHTVSGTLVSDGATIVVRSNTHIGNETLQLQGGGQSAAFAALAGGSGSNSWAGPITLTGDATVGAADKLNLLNRIDGVGGLTKIGGGVLIFSGGASNAYAGDTRVHQGTLLVRRTAAFASIPGDLFIGDGTGGPASDVVQIEGNVPQINTRAAVTIAASGLFDLNRPSETIGSLSGPGGASLGDNQLAVGGNDRSTSFEGKLLGTFRIVKNGRGTMTLTGDSPFSGTLHANEGTLLINGSQPRSAIVIEGGSSGAEPGILGGNGTVGRISAAGRLAPGASPGLLNCSNLTFVATGGYFIELDGPSPGIGYDQTSVRGSLALSGAGLFVSCSFHAAVGQSFTILLNDGVDPVIGSFNGLAEGTLFPVGGLLFRITYFGGDGNDVALLRASPPAPIITELRALPDGSRRLRGLGLPGLTYAIQAATNLNAPILWVVVGEDQANNAGVYEWLDLDAGSFPCRFYRALVP